VRLLRLFAVFFRIGLLAELAYRANFWVQAIESLLNLATVLAMLGAVFARTDALAGWSPDELLGLVGVYFLMLGALRVVISPSLERTIEGVRDGTFDFLLTKPVDAQLLASISEIRVWRLVDLALGVSVLTIALVRMAADVGPARALLFALALGLAGAIVYSFWVALAALAFWFVRIENILMIFWSVYTAGRWPVGIYPPWLRWILTAVVPVAFAVTVPAEALAGRLTIDTLATAGGLAVLAVLASRRFWKRGLRRYSGASA